MAPETPATFADMLVAAYPTLQASFFGGFVSLSGFMLSVYTFTVIRMKEHVYDDEQYQSVVVARARRHDKKVKPYGGLRRLSRLLSGTVLLTLVTATAQITLGMYDDRRAILACYGFVGSAIVLVVIDLAIVGLNLKDWFDMLDQRAIDAEESKDG